MRLDRSFGSLSTHSLNFSTHSHSYRKPSGHQSLISNRGTFLFLVLISKFLRIFRCPKDDTVIFHSGPSTSQRFSFEAFQFLNNQVEPYLYVHCEVELCNLTDFKPSCLRDCDNKLESRRRRAVNTDVYDLEQGPIVILRNYEDSFEDERVNEAASRRKEGIMKLLQLQM